MFLSRTEVAAIDARVAAVEAATGVQVVAAVIGKADDYAELPWKAFALGAALAAFATVLAEASRLEWTTAHAALVHAVTILGAGAGSALAAVFIPAFARMFLRATRRDLEVRHYARSLFLERELFKTRERTGVLILVSVFERRIELLPDVGFGNRVTAADWHRVVARMTPDLHGKRPFDALQEGLADLQDLLARRGFRPREGSVNELPDKPIQERGG
jgi:putative membrane protein